MICSHELKSIIGGLIKSAEEEKTYYNAAEYGKLGKIQGLEAALEEIEKLEKADEAKRDNSPTHKLV